MLPTKFQVFHPRGSEEDFYFLIFSSGDHFVYQSRTVLANFGRVSPKQHSYAV